MSNIVKFNPPRHAVRLYPDSERYKGGFAIRSETSDRVYKISFDAAHGAMWWTCSCTGNIIYGQCKHLTACGLKGRRSGHQLGEAHKYGWLK